ncbi:DnaJ domain-containing protein [bacterium SCSIO 12741]|nr:DnaJ domain-containing protein [bacterium SCSIO 12741]
MYQRYYRILGVTPEASLEEIKKAYRILARQYHPDSSNDPGTREKFIEVTLAYERILERRKRPLSYRIQSKKTIRKKVRKARKSRIHPRDRAAGYSELNYQRYKKKSSAYKSPEELKFYKWFYYVAFFFITLFAGWFTFMSSIVLIESHNPVSAAQVAASVYVFFVCFKRFTGWRKDQKHALEAQD